MRGSIDNSVSLAGKQTINGSKTFTGNGDGGIELAATNATNCGYVDFKDDLGKDYVTRLYCDKADTYLKCVRSGSSAELLLGRSLYSYSGNGYLKLSDGLQICWGSMLDGGTASFAHPFRQIFTATVSNVTAGDIAYTAYITALSTTQIAARMHVGDNTRTIYYIAIGMGV